MGVKRGLKRSDLKADKERENSRDKESEKGFKNLKCQREKESESENRHTAERDVKGSKVHTVKSVTLKRLSCEHFLLFHL